VGRESAYWGFESVMDATYSLTAGDMGPVDLSSLWLIGLISERVGLRPRLCDECGVCDECLEEDFDEHFEDDLADPFDDDWGRSFVDDFDGSLLVFECFLAEVEDPDPDTSPNKDWDALV